MATIASREDDQSCALGVFDVMVEVGILIKESIDRVGGKIDGTTVMRSAQSVTSRYLVKGVYACYLCDRSACSNIP